jgi:hypothetical protein
MTKAGNAYQFKEQRAVCYVAVVKPKHRSGLVNQFW